MRYDRKELLKYLYIKKIPYKEFNHKPLFTVDESKKLRGKIKGAHTKNLFLKDKKENFFLISCMEDKIIDLKKFRLAINTKNISFASDVHLKKLLNVEPGAVTPMALINDKNKMVTFFLDEDIINSESVNFHPLVNNYTITLSVKSFLIFMKNINVVLNLIDLKVYKQINIDGIFRK